MATIDITLTIPDAADAKVRAALIKHYTRDGVEPTALQAVNAFKNSVRSGLKQIVRDVDLQTRIDAAKAAVEEVDVT